MEALLAQLTILCGGLSLLCLLALHFASPEFGPSWRMISEYALGRHSWLITAFFLLWGAASILLQFKIGLPRLRLCVVRAKKLC